MRTELDPDQVIEKLGDQLIIKPTNEGSSVDLRVIEGKDSLVSALSKLETRDWMIEKRIFGREVTVGVLGGYATGIVEVIPSGGIYDFQRKYSAGSTEYRYPAVLDVETEHELKHFAIS